MRKFFYYIPIIWLIATITIIESRVYQKPNADDIDYWHSYNVKYLQKIINSNSVDQRIAKNVILFIGDGMSFATIAAGRVLKGQLEKKSGEETELVFEKFPHVALAKTYNTDNQVPDSAATATALFSGIKTSMGAVGINNPVSKEKASRKDRLKNIMDWAQEAKKRTGIVTTTRITHATPAAAYAYSPNRDYECDTQVPKSMKNFKDIARQLIENKPGKDMNVIFGGGRDFLGASDERYHQKIHFGGSAEISCNRTDKTDLVAKYLKQFGSDEVVRYAKTHGELVEALSQVDELDRVLGLFANNHMSYNTLRNNESDGEPSLSEMTGAAIKILGNKKSKNGFVLMVEGGKIDHAHHQNHARFALEEFVEFENAIKTAVEMTSSDDDTLIIVTSDHAHAMVYNGYATRGNDILGYGKNGDAPVYETLVYATGPGFWQHLINGSHSGGPFKAMENYTEEERKNPLYMHQSLIPLEDSSHSGDDVGVYSTGPGSFLLQRVFEQCYVAYAISYASCIGPMKSMNPFCSNHERDFKNNP